MLKVGDRIKFRVPPGCGQIEIEDTAIIIARKGDLGFTHISWQLFDYIILTDNLHHENSATWRTIFPDNDLAYLTHCLWLNKEHMIEILPEEDIYDLLDELPVDNYAL